jgi:hypothetical protein
MGKLAGGAIVSKEIEAGAVVENCHALIENKCRAFCGKAFATVSSAAELLFYLEFAASSFKKSELWSAPARARN